jgi:glycosyltransferase involved in cell wall biosynthesis
VASRKRADRKAREDRLRKRTEQAAAKQVAAKQAAAKNVAVSEKAGILITSTQYPYYGGAATNAYALIKYFRAAGHKVAGVFFDNTNNNVDPNKIGGVIRHKNNKETLAMVRATLGGDPDVIFAKNYAAPLLTRRIFPKTTLAYLVSGSPQMMKLSEKGVSANRYLVSKNIETFKQESRAFAASDYIVPNSAIGRRLLVKHYGNSAKILAPIDTSLARDLNIENKYFSKRRYNIAFICSNMSRSVKNAKLARNIFSRLDVKKKVVIGHGSGMFANINNVECLPAMTQDRLIRILNDTRLVICTSYYDASPNIIREALDCGSNILVSKNCGWSELYPAQFVCEDVYNEDEWIKKASILIKKNVKFPLKKEEKARDKSILTGLRGILYGQ